MQDVALRYVVFPRLLTTEEMGTMTLIDALPSNQIWIYKLDSRAPSADHAL
jgi:hypothetical protein